MRVRLAELSGSEVARRELSALDQRVRKRFSRNALSAGDVVSFQAALALVHPELALEFSDERTVVIRSERRELAQVARRVGSRVAELWPELGVLGSRPAVPLEACLSRLPRRGGADFSRVRFRAGFTRGHLLELVVSLPGGSGSEAEREVAERLVSDLLGEARAADWIGRVVVAPAPRGGPLRVMPAEPEASPSLALDELVPAVDAALSALDASLPSAPLHLANAGGWTLFELEPEPAESFPEKDDLVMAVTCVPELLKCYLEGAPFSSRRFSRHGELFCHLKYENGGEPEARLAERERLERCLDRVLIPREAGRVVGGGLGLRHGYVDFALSDLERGLSLVRDAARREKLASRSWIECFDAELAAEWLEIWPDAAPPPGQA